VNGRVYLVGAGPGDPGLMTARALELIAAADVILYDRLIPPAALDGARAEAELLFVGKQGGGESVPQEQTEELLIDRARAGRMVVRLKGGDPFVFGRGGEEALRLRAAGIPYEIVPGVTAGVAAAAYAGIPVTHRGLAGAVALITGHTREDGEPSTGEHVRPGAMTGAQGHGKKPGEGVGAEAGAQEHGKKPGAEVGAEAGAQEHGKKPGAEVGAEAGAQEHGKPGEGVGAEAGTQEHRKKPGAESSPSDWHGLAAFPGTLVFYMGVRRLPALAESLIAAGRAPDEPVAIVERGTLPGQRTVMGTLATIADVASAENVSAPAITVVGPVAALASELAWLQSLPLTGVTVAVTRARVSSSGLARRLESLGARVVQAPVIRTVPLPGPAPELARYDLLCLTSPAGVAALFERLRAGGEDARALAGTRVAAIGPGTAAALAERGIVADIVPERAVAEGLVTALADVSPPVERALIARAGAGREVLPDALRARGAEVDVLALYDTIAEAPPAPVLREALAADYVTFTSASTVRFFCRAIGSHPDSDSVFAPDTRIVSIGPITCEALREHGLRPHIEASSHDIDGLVQAIVSDVAARGR
jgi:siroheme synthase/uroporphyrinogen-III synthase